MRARTTVATVVIALAICFALAYAQKSSRSSATDEASIRKALQSYAAAYNKGDVDGIMELWADDGEFVDVNGKVIRGREALAGLFKKALAEQKGTAVKFRVRSLRFLKADLAVLDGAVDQTSPDGSEDTGRYTAIWTKTDGKWRLISVRDLPDDGETEASPTQAQLKQLAWLEGNWVNEDKDSVVTLSCRWSQKRSFLTIEQVVTVKGEEVLTVQQIIGWDPVQQQLRSWVFDSRSGYGQCLWTRQGNQWSVEGAGVLADGRETSSKNLWKFLDTNSFEWSATDREIDSEPVADVKVKYTRKGGKK